MKDTEVTNEMNLSYKCNNDQCFCLKDETDHMLKRKVSFSQVNSLELTQNVKLHIYTAVDMMEFTGFTTFYSQDRAG